MRESDVDIWRLQHIQDAINKIQDYLSDVKSFEQFFEDERIQASVKYELIVIGEACNKLSETTKAMADNTEWRAIISMRNYLAHEYFSVDINALWETIQLDLPPFHRTIKMMKDKLKKLK